MTDFKLAIGMFADVLYIKGIVCYEEYNDMMEIKQPSDIDVIIDNMLSDKYNVYKRGETYVGYQK